MVERPSFQAKQSSPDHPEEKCAVFAIYDPTGKDVAYDLTLGLSIMQDRGRGGTGIAVSDGDAIRVHRRERLVAEAYRTIDFQNELRGGIGIGHNRYATASRRAAFYHLQPVVQEEDAEKFLDRPIITTRGIVGAQNGNEPVVDLLEAFHKKNNIPNPGFNDAELMRSAVAHNVKMGMKLDEAVAEAAPLFSGAYGLIFMDNDEIVGIRDRAGVRPLVIGRDGERVILSSETSGIRAVRGNPEREVNPGEMIVINQSGMRSEQLFPKVHSQQDGFELAYFAGVSSEIDGKSIETIRQSLGWQLAEEEYDDLGHHLDADIVIAAPDSAYPGALGYANRSHIPFQFGFHKNNAIGRTFILPTQEERERAVNAKLHVNRDVVKNQRVILVEDTVVHGTTSRAGVAKLREAGAREVHLRVHTPPIMGPDFYGTNTNDQSKLAAAVRTMDELAEFIGVDSIRFLSEEGFHTATQKPEGHVTMSAFNMDYPIPIGKREREVDKSVYEKFVQNGRQYGYYRK